MTPQPVINWIRDNASRNSFAASLERYYTRNGFLSPGQVAAVQKSLTPVQTANVSGEGFNLLVRSFNHARSVGLKRPKLHVGPFKFWLAAEDSKNPGYIYVKANGEYSGKFSPDGTFTPWNASPDTVANLTDVARDPLAKAVAHGHATGNCAVCGRPLSDSESVTRGIGPVCAKRFGWSL